MTYRLEITISDNGYSSVIGHSDMPCFIVDKFKAEAQRIAKQLNNSK